MRGHKRDMFFIVEPTKIITNGGANKPYHIFKIFYSESKAIAHLGGGDIQYFYLQKTTKQNI